MLLGTRGAVLTTLPYSRQMMIDLLFSDVESSVPRFDGPIRDEIVQVAEV